MENYENTPARETTTDVILQELRDEKDNPTFIKEYLKAEFLSSAIDTLFYARQQANFTQTQIAEQLKTKQTAIARLEADTNGSLSLRRYVDFALACGMVPLNITLAPIDSVRDFIKDHPDLPLTQEHYSIWMQRKAVLTSTFQYTSDHPLIVQTVIDNLKTYITAFLNQKTLQEREAEDKHVQYSKYVEQTLQQGNRGGIINTASTSSSLDQAQTANSSTQSKTSLINKVAA